jgi:putative transposase
MLISIPPKYLVSQVMGFIQGKSAYAFGAKLYAIARKYGGKRKNCVRQYFWARGYYVLTVGREEAIVRQSIQRQEAEDQRIEQLRLTDEWSVQAALSGSHTLKLPALPEDTFTTGSTTPNSPF